ncbi:MAG: hypothetical protein KAQ83_02685 [Nanoarchaeota archaeon]|nr:hypothetical protein [Nanoarchaeota archaeon]
MINNPKLAQKSKDQIPLFMTPLFAQTVFQEVLIKKYPNFSKELFFKIGKGIGITYTKKISEKRLPPIQIIKSFLKKLSKRGFGNGQINQINFKSCMGIISFQTSPFAKQYQKTFGTQSECIDFFISGLLSGCFTVVGKKDCYLKETKCVANGDIKCIFELQCESIFQEEFIEQEKVNEVLEWNKIELRESNEQLNNLTKKIIVTKQLKEKDGALNVWNIFICFMPIDLYETTSRIMKWYGKSIKYELLYMSICQAKIAVQFQIDAFGIQKGMPSFLGVFNQLNFFGMGDSKFILNSNEEAHALFLNNNSLAQFNKNKTKDDKYFNFFVEGLIIGGIEESFDDYVKSITIKTKNNTSEYIFKLTKDKEKSINYKCIKEINNKEIQTVLEEHMKHKYYLSKL